MADGMNSYVVCTWKKSDNNLARMHLKTFNGSPNCLVWQAGLATSAAPTFFDAVVINTPEGPLRLEDGGLTYNNPIETFDLFEVEHFSGVANPVRQCYVSIGTGRPTPGQTAPTRNFWRYLQRLIDSMNIVDAARQAAAVATDTENKHLTFERANRNRPDIRYYRFNCGNGLAEITLDKAEALGYIKQLTEGYLESFDFTQQRDSLRLEI